MLKNALDLDVGSNVVDSSCPCSSGDDYEYNLLHPHSQSAYRYDHNYIMHKLKSEIGRRRMGSQLICRVPFRFGKRAFFVVHS